MEELTANPAAYGVKKLQRLPRVKPVALGYADRFFREWLALIALRSNDSLSEG